MPSSLKTRFKHWLYGSCPGFAGSFPYYGVKTYFPKNSFVFRIACDQGIYEAANTRILLSALRPKTTVFDVGANIGLMSIPLITQPEKVDVVSIEPSPQNHTALARTVAESGHTDHWTLLDCAVGSTEGLTKFHCARPSMGAFDGLRNTGRAGEMIEIEVKIRTLDEIWASRGRPDVCVIKIDVEGAEQSVLEGSEACVAACRPLILVEWNDENLRAFGHSSADLLNFANKMNYTVHAMPGLVQSLSPAHLRAQMQFDESFVLLPR